VRTLLSQTDQLVDIDEDDASGKTADDYAVGNPRIRRELKRYRTLRKKLFRNQLIGRYTRPLFAFYDINGDSMISKEEYVSLQAQFLEICGEEMDWTALSKDFDKFDVDHDNKINYEEFKDNFEEMTHTLNCDISQVIDGMKKVRRKITVCALATLIPVDPGASDEFTTRCEDLLIDGQQVRALRKMLEVHPNALLKEKSLKPMVALVVSDDLGSVGMSVHLDMNPSWVEDILFILTPLEF